MDSSVTPLVVHAPLAGTVIDLKETSDLVFSRGLIGPGVAIDPQSVDTIEVTAPVSGKLIKVFPHAFMVSAGEHTVLVHLGIDTVKTNGHGYTILAGEGEQVEAGQSVISWQIGKARKAGYSVLCPVVLLEDSAPDLNILVPYLEQVTVGTDLLSVD